MNHRLQWSIVGLLILVVVLQLTVLGKIDAVKPKAQQGAKVDQARIPTLEQIDQRIMHWTMHHGQHFSANSRVAGLESKVSRFESSMENRLDRIEQKLEQLSTEE